MSTRAMYTFKDRHESFNVYKHHDGYPEGGTSAIAKAVPYSWSLPRFEASDFSAAFVAANRSTREQAAEVAKTYGFAHHLDCGGGVRLMNSGFWQDVAPQDLEYRYEISCENGEIQVAIFAVRHRDAWTERPLFRGSLEAAKTYSEAE